MVTSEEMIKEVVPHLISMLNKWSVLHPGFLIQSSALFPLDVLGRCLTMGNDFSLEEASQTGPDRTLMSSPMSSPFWQYAVFAHILVLLSLLP